MIICERMSPSLGITNVIILGYNANILSVFQFDIMVIIIEKAKRKAQRVLSEEIALARAKRENKPLEEYAHRADYNIVVSPYRQILTRTLKKLEIFFKKNLK